MRRNLTLTVMALALAGTLTACSSDGSSSGTGDAAAGGSTTADGYGAPADGATTADGADGAAAPATAAALGTASTSLGTIVVDGAGMTAYYFDKDTAGSGTSACTGDCAALWPAITTATATPQVDGVTAEVGTIPTGDGAMQLTLDGRPVYTYAADAAPGDTTGQGVGGIWYVVAPDGSEIGK